MQNTNIDSAIVAEILNTYRILGPLQGGGLYEDEGNTVQTRIILLQPYRDEIEAAIGGTLLDEAWDLEINGVGKTREVGRVVDQITDVEEISTAEIPTGFTLEQNYPNPFNPSTRIRFTVPEAGHYTLKVYDLLGQEVSTLVDEYRNAGTHEVTFEGSDLASGIYTYRIIARKYSATKKMEILK